MAKAQLPTTAKPKNDAYTGILFISLLATIGACVLLYLDYSSYENRVPPKSPAIEVPGKGGSNPGTSNKMTPPVNNVPPGKTGLAPNKGIKSNPNRIVDLDPKKIEPKIQHPPKLASFVPNGVPTSVPNAVPTSVPSVNNSNSKNVIPALFEEPKSVPGTNNTIPIAPPQLTKQPESSLPSFELPSVSKTIIKETAPLSAPTIQATTTLGSPSIDPQRTLPTISSPSISGVPSISGTTNPTTSALPPTVPSLGTSTFPATTTKEPPFAPIGIPVSTPPVLTAPVSPTANLPTIAPTSTSNKYSPNFPDISAPTITPAPSNLVPTTVKPATTTTKPNSVPTTVPTSVPTTVPTTKSMPQIPDLPTTNLMDDPPVVRPFVPEK